MKINSVVVGIQYHKGVEALNKGDEVELVFNDETHEFPTGIRVLNNDGVVVGNIIANMNHPSISEDMIVFNDLKNNSYIRRVTTDNCKAVVVGIKRYVVFITIHTDILVDNEENNDNEDDNMAIEKVYTIKAEKDEVEGLDEATWSIFTQCDEISAKAYFKDNKYIVEAYYEDEYLCKVCEAKLKELGFKEVNGDTMDLKERIEELEAKIEENKAQRRQLRKERVAMKKELKELKEQLEEVENTTDEVVEETTDVEEEKGETMTIEDKIKALDTPTISKSTMERNIPLMMIEMQNGELKEAFEKGMEEYPIEFKLLTQQNMDLYPIATILLSLRALDDFVAKQYLNGEISGGKFDHTRTWITIQGYFYYNVIIEKIEMDEFFTDASLRASEKFIDEQKERSEAYRDDDDEDCGDNTTSSSSINNNDNDDDDYGENPTIEFVSWTQQSYAWCGSDVTIKVNGKEITLHRPLISGGSVWFDDGWSEHVEDGPWSIDEDALPNNLKAHIKKIEEVVNENIPEGCCGGCV